MADIGQPESGPPGSSTPSGAGFLGSERLGSETRTDGKNDNAKPTSDNTQQTPQQAQETTVAKIHQELQQTSTSQKPSVAATEGAAQAGSAQQGKDVQSVPQSKQVASSEVISSPQAKANNASLSGDKTVPSPSPKPADIARSDVSSASQLLPKTTLENTKAVTDNKSLPRTGSQSDLGKVQDTSAPTTADRPGHKTELQNAPLGGQGREQKDSQAPPPVTKGQESTSQAQTQTPKFTTQETKSESKSASIPPPVIIPTDTHQAQKNQNPASTAHQPEPAPVASQKDLTAKQADSNVRSTEVPKQTTTYGKTASEALKDLKSESARSPELAGAGTDKNSAGNGPIVHEQPNLSEATTKHGEPKSDVARGEQATTEATHKPETQEPSKEIRVDTTDSLTDRNNIVIDKNTKTQVEGTRDTAIGNRAGEAATGNRDGKQEPPGKDKTADIANKTDTHLPGNDVSSASMGASFDGRPGRVNDKAEQKAETTDRGEVFKTQDGKPVKLDLTNKETCKQVLDLINQIETNKFKPLDQTGRGRLNLLLEIEPNSRTALKEILQAFVLKDKPIDLESALVLMSDKLDSVIAKQFKDMADGRIDDAQKLQRLEAKVKDAGNFITSFASHVFEAFNRILGNARNSVNSSEAASVDDIYNEAHSEKMLTISVIEHTASEQREQLLDKLAAQTVAMDNTEIVRNEDLEVEQTDDDTNANSKKVDPSGCSREEYLVQDKETLRSIARKCFNNEILWQLIWEINKPEATYSAVNDAIENRDFHAGERIYLPTYAERQKVLQPEEAPQ